MRCMEQTVIWGYDQHILWLKMILIQTTYALPQIELLSKHDLAFNYPRVAVNILWSKNGSHLSFSFIQVGDIIIL